MDIDIDVDVDIDTITNMSVNTCCCIQVLVYRVEEEKGRLMFHVRYCGVDFVCMGLL